MARRTFWLRWSWRDLRARWLVVTATALVIAMGTGFSSALGGMERFRVDSNDASFSALAAHDLRVTMSEGSYAPQGRLVRELRRIPHAGWVDAARERLVAPTQVDASRGGRTILTPGRIVGVDLGPGPPVDRLAALAGRGLGPQDAGRRVAVLEATYARHYDLPASGTVRVAGGGRLPYVGHGTIPEHFLVIDHAGWSAEANLAILFVPLRAAQALAGRPGKVNELVLGLEHGADAAVVERELERSLELAGIGATTTRLAEEDAHRILYRDAHNDQRVYGVFAALLLAGAAFAAFNLISRVVEAQRREIGIGMALGVEPRTLALRPLLMGAEIAVLGVAFGVGVGLLASNLFASAIERLLPLPVYGEPFQAGAFLRAALLGLMLPFAATAYPVWRGVRVAPIEAIRVGLRSARGGGLAPIVKRLPLPGGTFGQMPLRNVLRTPRRTLLTVLGLGAVITTVVAMGGMIDSIRATSDRSAQETLRGSPDRLVVTLAGFVPADAPGLAALGRSPYLTAAEPGLRLGGTLSPGRGEIDVLIELVNPHSRLWRPRVTDGALAPGRPGIVISQRAAENLGAEVGDTIALRHPRRTGPTAFEVVTTRVPVAGIHPNPFRFLAYMDASQARLMGLAGAANTVSVQPAPGIGGDRVKRALFGRRGVASVQAASATTDALDAALDDFVAVIAIAEGAALVLALLIAFNATSISADERAREHATMFAFGVPVRIVVRMSIVESVLMGLLGTLVGIGIGLAILSWVVSSLLPETFPELGAIVSIAPTSLLAAALTGVLAMSIAPLLAIRRLRRMDVPATLRVVE